MENVAAQLVEYTDREREERGDPPITAFEEVRAAAAIVKHGLAIHRNPVKGVAKLIDSIANDKF
ncbi:hypothetical protein OHB05_39040 [Streptomyces sp. NBC_00638]|uniref:hypothetical protein n=1 Tax=unclassified Streptomyces TaxID=2593676 RepID=UPI002256BDC2|nr:hypothetical protein [Streptomyces sp. NBC_00638]MCX5008553.1 hypothetical protein [Streptomyces sp. NBC_00638]